TPYIISKLLAASASPRTLLSLLHDALPILTSAFEAFSDHKEFILRYFFLKDGFVLEVQLMRHIRMKRKDFIGATFSERIHKFARSEEHTSELQSRDNIVCRLLVE